MKKASYPLCMLSGAIGKKIVVKQYRNGTIITKYPDMKKITSSERQKNCRNLFAEAVAFARTINNSPEKKEKYMKKVTTGKTVYNMAIKEYITSSRAKTYFKREYWNL